MARLDCRMMKAICAKLLLFLSVIISKSAHTGYHAFQVSIQTGNSLPVIGEDFTLVCTFTPHTRNRLVIWEGSDDLNTLASHNCQEHLSCRLNVIDQRKFSLLADYYSVNLTIKQLELNDGDTYKCTVSDTHGPGNTGSTIVQVTPLPAVAPYWVFIKDERSVGYYPNNANITVTAGEPFDVTCAADWARPPAVLDWRIPDDVIVVLQDQSDVVRENSFFSRKAATITPSRNDQGEILRCVASHPQLQTNLQRSVYLNVQVLPSSMLLFPTGDNKEYESGSTFIYVQEGTWTSITCKSIGSLPAVELSWTIPGDTSIIPRNSNLSKYRNTLDGTLFDTESNIAVHPKIKHHGMFIQCHASFDEVFIDHLLAKLIVYGSPDDIKISTPGDLHEGIETNVSCRAVNGYPAPFIHWYIGSINVTHDSSLRTSVNGADRYDAESTLTLIPKRFDHGKPLLCQAVQPTTTSMRSMNDSIALNISFIPDLPSGFFVDPNQTTSSTLIVAWQPGFNGGLNQTFTLQYCPNGTQDEGCGVVPNLTGTRFTLVGLNPLTSYRMTLWAVNSAGNSSTVETVASTTGLQPNSTDSPDGKGPSNGPEGSLSFMTIAIGVIASAAFILLISLGLMYFYGVLCCVKRKKADDGDNAQEGRTVDDDGLVYMSVSHDRVHPPNAPPIQTEEPTVYASLNSDVTQRRKGEMKYADTKATTPDGQPMYGNYLVKKRKQEQARMPPPIQTDDASYHAEGMECRKGGMKGAMGPTTPDGQPMYGNYLVKMRKDEERAKQMAGTHDVFEMYGI